MRGLMHDGTGHLLNRYVLGCEEPFIELAGRRRLYKLACRARYGGDPNPTEIPDYLSVSNRIDAAYQLQRGYDFIYVTTALVSIIENQHSLDGSLVAEPDA